MKGIREAAFSKDEPEENERYNPNFDHDRYDGHYGSYKPQKSLFDRYNPIKYPSYNDTIIEENQIKITFNISKKSLGNIADEDNEKYNWVKADQAAEDAAKDKLYQLIGKDLTKKYTYNIDLDNQWYDYEITITLLPKK